VNPPVAGPDHDWSSLVLTNSSTSAGYVSNADVKAAMLVTPTGGVQLWLFVQSSPLSECPAAANTDAAIAAAQQNYLRPASPVRG
jgi:hypothetical protein